MKWRSLIQGEEVALPAMLDARERRAYIQMRLIEEYKTALVSFTLNIAGPVKVFGLSRSAFEEGLQLIRIRCREYGIPIVHEYVLRENTGWEAFLSVDAGPEFVKRILTDLEDEHSLGRLFDIDIIRRDLSKVSRKELGRQERRCLICGGPAFVCAGRRLHTVEALQERTVQIMWDYFAFRYADDTAMTACRALLYEVMATPKPGLVDRAGTGAHEDMDIFTFETSALALLPYFRRFVSYGIENAHLEPEALLTGIRSVGREADLAMLRATGGINTHKGAIFSVGILCVALGWLYGTGKAWEGESLSDTARRIACDVMRELRGLSASGEEKRRLTHGERLYLEHGTGGIRLEAARGFPTLFESALPALEDLLGRGFSLNDAGILTLMKILAETEDTSLISRCGYDRAGYYREKAGRLWETFKDAQPGDPAYLEALEEMDREMVRDHASPGGSADLLAMTYFLHFLRTGQVPSRIS